MVTNYRDRGGGGLQKSAEGEGQVLLQQKGGTQRFEVVLRRELEDLVIVMGGAQTVLDLRFHNCIAPSL